MISKGVVIPSKGFVVSDTPLDHPKLRRKWKLLQSFKWWLNDMNRDFEDENIRSQIQFQHQQYLKKQRQREEVKINRSNKSTTNHKGEN